MIRSWQKILVPKLHVNGITLFPFILIRTEHLQADPVFLQHEHIHLRQQLEMGILPFYVAYLLHYAINRIKRMDHDTAYRNICFEREAYAQERTAGYLKKRSVWNWIHYLAKRQ